MFVWMSGFDNPLAYTHFNMFVDEGMSANKSPVSYCKVSLSGHCLMRLFKSLIKELLQSIIKQPPLNETFQKSR